MALVFNLELTCVQCHQFENTHSRASISEQVFKIIFFKSLNMANQKYQNILKIAVRLLIKTVSTGIFEINYSN